MSPFCTSWPDLKHTVIQQIFIKRLFVQGTSGEGGLQPGPLPRPTPSAVTPGGRSPPTHRRAQPPRSRCAGLHPNPAAGPPGSAAATSPRPPHPPRPARRYAQTAQPHLVGFSTSSAKEVPSLHSKVNFLRFNRRPWQQP